ncbi:hypothetical protein D0Z07_3078 [Hyphodiscus hymeniophilus]|uniref:Uncharacterized protein n=1 Tax=Hyphodiscus hymeniophilus TaxID=353542 RepID=A0A9P6VN01_9HELO|nr:hypothetical protein D0Z07_3078 [Hyphodiscus hymeniophilus]
MNLGAIDVQRVHHDRPQLQRIYTDELPTTPVHVQIDDDRTPSFTSSISAAETVIRWETPPSRVRTPQRSSETLRQSSKRQSIGANEAAYASNTPLVVRFDEEQIRSDEVEASKKERSPKKMDDVSLESEPPTPGTDDTPYLRFAIEQLTRDQEIRAAQRSISERSSDSYPVERIIPNHLRDDYIQPGTVHTREELALARKHRSSPGPESTHPPGRLFRYNATRPLTTESAVQVPMRDHLKIRSDRLGYWRTPNRTQGIFYCVGEAGASTRQYTLEGGKIHEKPSRSDIYQHSDVEKATLLHSEEVRFRYITWYLRDSFTIFWAVAAFILLLALIVVSFLSSTAIRKGFAPQVSPVSNSQGFSPANFLYSFIPSIIGLLLYLFFQPLDMSLRQLQPWAELGQEGGGTADQSLLSDYISRSPIGCAWHAFGAGHYKVAIVSTMSFLFILLPILGGGLFFALTTPSNGVRMIPNLPAFYILLAILILYLLGLLILIPNRRLLHLPHAIDCLAEIFSFVYNSQMLDDASFRSPRTKADLVARLMSVRVGGREAKYEFGVHEGRDGREWIGIERIGRDGHRRQIFGRQI